MTNKGSRKPNGQSRMNNPETLATSGTQDTRRSTNQSQKHNTTQKTKKMSNTDQHQKNGVNTGARQGQAVHASYKTPVVVLLHIVKSDNEKKNIKHFLRDKMGRFCKSSWLNILIPRKQ